MLRIDQRERKIFKSHEYIEATNKPNKVIILRPRTRWVICKTRIKYRFLIIVGT